MSLCIYQSSRSTHSLVEGNLTRNSNRGSAPKRLCEWDASVELEPKASRKKCSSIILVLGDTRSYLLHACVACCAAHCTSCYLDRSDTKNKRRFKYVASILFSIIRRSESSRLQSDVSPRHITNCCIWTNTTW